MAGARFGLVLSWYVTSCCKHASLLEHGASGARSEAVKDATEAERAHLEAWHAVVCRLCVTLDVLDVVVAECEAQ